MVEMCQCARKTGRRGGLGGGTEARLRGDSNTIWPQSCLLDERLSPRVSVGGAAARGWGGQGDGRDQGRARSMRARVRHSGAGFGAAANNEANHAVGSTECKIAARQQPTRRDSSNLAALCCNDCHIQQQVGCNECHISANHAQVGRQRQRYNKSNKRYI